jgi:hexosaminidase
MSFLLLMPALTRLACGLQSPPVQFTVTPDHGLQVSFAGVPIVQGSWIQYYEPGWSKAYFSSVNSTQAVQKLANGDVVLMFRSQDGKAYGTELFSPLPDGVKATYSFGWTGEKPVDVEVTAGALWATALSQISMDGKPARPLQALNYGTDEINQRAYGLGGKEFVFDAPAGKITFRSVSPGWSCFDARGYSKPWAKGRDLLWLGMLSLHLAAGEVASTEAEWHFEPVVNVPTRGGFARLDAAPLSQALMPSEDSFPLLPKPKQAMLNKDDPMVLDDELGVDLPGSVPYIQQELGDAIKRRWDVPGFAVRESRSPRVFIRLQNLGLPAEGYEIRINRKTALILGQDLLGLKHAVDTFAQLLFARNAKMCLPSGIIRDWPSAAWRGVHLFVGPNALAFHKRLWDRVLRPLKFDHVVLECERTAWRALGNPPPPGYMKRDDLVRLFDYYRDQGIEPIPLIQSFGHMDWLLGLKQNQDAALYPDPATTLDPRSQKAKDLIYKIWDEAIALLRPKAVHFGLDEVDAKWPTQDPGLMTQLWQTQLAYLSAIAAQHHVGLMCWGDQCLAPGEAVDATLGDSKDDAKTRRTAIPKGAMVTDWHYKNDPSPDRFLPSLALWKAEGIMPIASTWFRPENIRGFYLAAIQQGAGTLQTTWAGHQSDEKNMLREYRQFAAMVVAADYAWSGRQDDWDKLGYDAGEVFARMYFQEPSRLTPVAGWSLGGGAATTRVGDVQFKLMQPYWLRSLLTDQTARLPQDLVIETPALKGSEVAFALDTTVPAEEGKPVAQVEIESESGVLAKVDIIYGQEVRAVTDSKSNTIAPRNGGLSLMRIKLPNGPTVIRRITFRGTSSYAGLRVHGITAF